MQRLAQAPSRALAHLWLPLLQRPRAPSRRLCRRRGPPLLSVQLRGAGVVRLHVSPHAQLLGRLPSLLHVLGRMPPALLPLLPRRRVLVAVLGAVHVAALLRQGGVGCGGVWPGGTAGGQQVAAATGGGGGKPWWASRPHFCLTLNSMAARSHSGVARSHSPLMRKLSSEGVVSLTASWYSFSASLCLSTMAAAMGGRTQKYRTFSLSFLIDHGARAVQAMLQREAELQGRLISDSQ